MFGVEQMCKFGLFILGGSWKFSFELGHPGENYLGTVVRAVRA